MRGSHLVVVEGVDDSDESSCLWSHADGHLGNVLDKEGVEVAAKLQIISCTQRLQETESVNVRSHDKSSRYQTCTGLVLFSSLPNVFFTLLQRSSNVSSASEPAALGTTSSLPRNLSTRGVGAVVGDCDNNTPLGCMMGGTH